MNKNYCTTIPARRVSQKAIIEMRVASDLAAFVRISARYAEGNVAECGIFPIKPGRKLNKLYPNTFGIFGSFVFEIRFLDASRQILELIEQPYEIVISDVHSTCLLDGSWVSLYHWSDQEARYFNKGLRHMTNQDWKNHVYSMKKIGITSVLIQNVFDSKRYVNQHDMTADTYDGKAFYDSKLYPGRMDVDADDPVEAIFSAADECDMAVFPGVGLYAWFDFSPESLKWHKRVTKELFERYGHHRSLYGWYLSEEIMGALYYGYDPVPDEKYRDIQNFMREYAAFVHELTPTKPIALAPNNIHMDWYKDEWRGILEYLDIMVPFAFARSENNIPQIQAMCLETGTHFWVDMEIFDFPFDEGLRPKNWEKLIKEIHCYDMLEQIYGYQYTGLMNDPENHPKDLGMKETEDIYLAYRKHVDEIRQKSLEARRAAWPMRHENPALSDDAG